MNEEGRAECNYALLSPHVMSQSSQHVVPFEMVVSENLMKILSLTEQDLVPLDLNYIGSANRKSNLTVMGRTKEAVTIKLPNIKTVFKAHITFLKVMFKNITATM